MHLVNIGLSLAIIHVAGGLVDGLSENNASLAYPTGLSSGPSVAIDKVLSHMKLFVYVLYLLIVQNIFIIVCGSWLQADNRICQNSVTGRTYMTINSWIIFPPISNLQVIVVRRCVRLHICTT